MSTARQNVSHLFGSFDLRRRDRWRDDCHGVIRVKDINWVAGEATQAAAQL